MAYDKVVDSAVLDAGLKQIADAIREKAGTTDALAFPQAMADAIAAIQGGGATIEPLTISENGTYTAPDGVDGYSPVTVDVKNGSSDDVYVLGRKVQYGTFIPSEDTHSFEVSHNLGSIPSGCMYWAVSDVIENTAQKSYILGSYISDHYGKTMITPTWINSVIVVEDGASSTSDTPTSKGRLKTATGGGAGYPWSGQSNSSTVMNLATKNSVCLGGNVAYFVAGMEYHYILFGGVE